MPRSIWKGAISFGMISIPVKLYGATKEKDLSFNLLHEPCKSRLKQLRWCPVHERPVEWSEIVRGYEYAEDQYVVLTEDDFDAVPVPSKHTIELSAFVRAAEIDPVYYEKSYYLEPDEVGVKAFALLLRAIEEKGLTALARIAIRDKEQLCALRAANGTLMLETLFAGDEIHIEEPAKIPAKEVSSRELQMAFSLIDLLSEQFDPDQYHDGYREALMDRIEAKLQGHDVVESAEPAANKVVDLMAALRASVEDTKRRKEGESPRGSGRKRRLAGVR